MITIYSDCKNKIANMSATDLNFQAQVESVLSELVKVATLELTKLFETRYQASVGAIFQTANRKWPNETPERLERCEESDAKVSRSIGVQVNENNALQADLSNLQNTDGSGDCLKTREEEHSPPIDIPLREEVDLLGSLVKEESGQSSLAAEHHQTTACCVAQANSDDQKPESSQASPTKLKALLVHPENESDVLAKGQVKFVCPLFLKPELQGTEDERSKAEPQPTNVSTAQGMAYSPSPSDGASTPPLDVKVWERICSVKEDDDSQLQLRLKLTYPDHNLVRPCSVRLVNMLAAAQTGAWQGTGVKRQSGSPTHKDLPHHQGLHTGHRLCCYTKCGDSVWRLQEVVAHTRDGYGCKICGKHFKRRKVLRRHKRFHTGEKPYTCTCCSKGFALRKSLRRHQRFHTGERPHNCPKCGKSFRLRENLKAHLRFHTGEKPFVCSVCGKSYRISKNLEKHNLSQCGFLVPSFRKIAGL